MSELLACCSARFAELQELLGSAGSSPTEMKGSIGRARIGESVLEISSLKLSESPASFCQALESFLPHPLLWRYLLRAYRWEGTARSAKISLPTRSPWAPTCPNRLLNPSFFPLPIKPLSRRVAEGWHRSCSEQGAPFAPCVRVTSTRHRNRWVQ